jgi:hypothetical protein
MLAATCTMWDTLGWGGALVGIVSRSDMVRTMAADVHEEGDEQDR